MVRTRANLFSDSSSLCRVCMILDLGDCETFFANYMEVVRFFPCFRGGLSAGADISWGIMVVIFEHIFGPSF